MGPRTGLEGLDEAIPCVLEEEAVAAVAAFFCGTLAGGFADAMEDEPFGDLSALFASDDCGSGVAILCANICANTGKPLADVGAAGLAEAAGGGFTAGVFDCIVAMKAAGIMLHSKSGAVHAQGPPFPVARLDDTYPSIAERVAGSCEIGICGGTGQIVSCCGNLCPGRRETNCSSCGMFG